MPIHNENELIQIIQNSRGNIYGGALRDKIAGIAPVDLDVFIAGDDNEKLARELIFNLSKQMPIQHTNIVDGSYRNKHLRLHGPELVSRWQLAHIDIILCTNNPWESGENESKMCDLSCNLLYLTPKNELNAFMYRLLPVLKHCRNKQFERWGDSKDIKERAEKMIARGWDDVTNSVT